ncbi:uncharacterized protein LOC131857708 [Cryptomeria japonica]|uniref:uncharacterized protein LOC131857708 n=1 Tax=Cryptomeria japonica TaxID=3369 RepID=UPI0027DA7867|nr:uncharacterized protein LOC131857708 [Cryptomeria japonica]
MVIDFLTDNILTRFGCPERIVYENAMSFRLEEYEDFCNKYGIQISYSSCYHPQGKGQVESSNKSLMKIIKRILEKNKRAWDSKLRLAILVDNVTIKKAIRCAPFDFVYGIHAWLPQNNLMEMYKFVQTYNNNIDDDMQLRIEALMELDEARREASTRKTKLQMQVKNLYDKRTTARIFQVNDLVLMWNGRIEDKGKHGMFDAIWMGPYLIRIKWGEDSYILQDIHGDTLELPINGQFLKLYYS